MATPDSAKMPAAVTIGVNTNPSLFINFFLHEKFLLDYLQSNCCAAPWRQTRVIFSKHSETYRGESASRHGKSVETFDQTVG
jgi:hypothetical protein